MSRKAVAYSIRREPPERRRIRQQRAPFISVAFMAAIVFGPLVIATGLLTAKERDGGARSNVLDRVEVAHDASGTPVPTFRHQAPDLGPADFRQSLDAEPPRLRPSIESSETRLELQR